ncbi:MAG: hypothetical protein N0C81_04705 [Candidatus Thiodiazotropha lotti]|nr:hypothetical protein [Candidatus Thiodiazotropha lotti]MCG7931878.1 hypothetical protein [Candidatus Thiodiazotropha lotti]MCG7989038.1 hypothetical protein [Candidatus Thiodiazotropha lotti]MCG8005229.1 hypothetical protein [Candidatus Thiodiazotropha lotti]MCG8006936.1 hypothetical protein [Candidatus Thiodiazotropha lotti]
MKTISSSKMILLPVIPVHAGITTLRGEKAQQRASHNDPVITGQYASEKGRYVFAISTTDIS